MDCCKNEDRTLWERGTQEEPFLSYASIGLTKNDALILCLGGHCVVLPIEQWHKLALDSFAVKGPFPATPAPTDKEAHEMDWGNTTRDDAGFTEPPHEGG